MPFLGKTGGVKAGEERSGRTGAERHRYQAFQWRNGSGNGAGNGGGNSNRNRNRNK